MESTGTQYIDTRYIPNETSGLRCTQSTVFNQDYVAFGCRNNVSTDTRFACSRERIGIIESTALGCGWGEWRRIREGTYGQLVNEVHGTGKLNWLNSQLAYYESFISGKKDVIELPALNFVPEFSVFLFANNITGTVSNNFSGRIYNAGISEENRVLHELVPALDPTGAPCMFDIVSRKPFYNSGSGDFIYPNMEQQASTYSLRNRMYAKMTKYGIQRLYHVPMGCLLSKEEYVEQNGFKLLVETPQPEVGYWLPVWHEREDCIELEWVETEPPVNQEENI